MLVMPKSTLRDIRRQRATAFHLGVTLIGFAVRINCWAKTWTSHTYCAMYVYHRNENAREIPRLDLIFSSTPYEAR